MLTVSQFDSLTRECLDPILVLQNGYQFSKGTFYREHPSRVRHVIIIDLEPKARKEFRVILGVNSSVIMEGVEPSEAGVCCPWYLTGGGVSSSPRKFPCYNSEKARESFRHAESSIQNYGLRWLSSYATLSHIARALGPEYDYLRGKLYLADGQLALARDEFVAYKTRLDSMPSSPRIRETQRELEQLLKRC